MKKVFKSRLFLIIITTLIVSSVSVYATVQFTASSIPFNPSNTDWEVNNVGSALDQLYTKSTADLVFSNLTGSRSYGGALATGERKSDVTLNKGKYFVTVVSSHALNSTTNTDERHAVAVPQANSRNVECNNNCNITNVSRNYSVGTSSGKDGNNNYRMSVIVVDNYYIDITTDGTVVSGSMTTWTHSKNDYSAEQVLITAVEVTK